MAILISLFSAGCSTRLADLTVLSTKNIDFQQLSKSQRLSSRVKGSDKKILIFVIPTGVPNVKTAVDRAIESVPNCVALTDAVVYAEQFWFVLGEFGFLIEGTPIVTPSKTAMEDTRRRQTQPEIVRVDMRANTVNQVAVGRSELDRLKAELKKSKKQNPA